MSNVIGGQVFHLKCKRYIPSAHIFLNTMSFFFQVSSMPNMGLESQPQDQELLAVLTEPVRCPQFLSEKNQRSLEKLLRKHKMSQEHGNILI